MIRHAALAADAGSFGMKDATGLQIVDRRTLV
jgi:hypothetical protein